VPEPEPVIALESAQNGGEDSDSDGDVDDLINDLTDNIVRMRRKNVVAAHLRVSCVHAIVGCLIFASLPITDRRWPHRRLQRRSVAMQRCIIYLWRLPLFKVSRSLLTRR
jgi:hypothetical protein